ncbi:MAG TPA: hypothetical protein VFU97_00650 [Xanthobacteraceae bacterium]|nr:hypothetical protein [Xanthobacteraceae bacterium]
MNRPVVQLAPTCCRAVGLALALALPLPLAAHGEVQIEGDPAAVRITTSGNSIGDVLSALGAVFKLQNRSAIDLDAPAKPAYSGPIDRVIGSLLDGFNYAVKKSEGQTEIMIFGRRGTVAIPAPAPKPSEAAGILSRWR